MKIFISWSDERSEALAKALHEWFPLVLHYVDPWLSQSNIEAGTRPYVEIAKGLEACNFGVICITKDNLNSPWILFESGALSKSMEEGRVIPLLLDIDKKEIPSSNPLAQFQAKKAEKSDIHELVKSLNKVASSPVPDAQLDKLFESLWDRLNQVIGSIPKNQTPAKHSRPDGEILEELVSSVRGVEMRMRENMDEPSSWRRRRHSKIHPMMMMEISHRIGNGPQDPIRLLIGASFFRDEAPWLYEMALEAYRAIKAGAREEAREAYRRYAEAMEFLGRGPFAEELGLDRRMFREFFDESQMWFEEPLEETIEEVAKRRGPKARPAGERK